MSGRGPTGKSSRARTGGELLELANRAMRRAGVAHGQGFLGPEEESLTLLGYVLGLAWEDLPDCFRKPVSADAERRFLGLVDRRVRERTPTAYLVGEAWLGGLRFKVDERVIIPRSYFVELIPEVIPAWLPPAKTVRRIADVCTGSGCLAVLLALRFPEARVDATDLSADALAVARENLAAHGLTGRVRLHRTDVMRSLAGKARYDLIVSNPPYEPTAVLKRLPAEFHREPPDALVSGKDGLDVIRRLLIQAAESLLPHGALVIEVGGLREAMAREWPGLRFCWLPTADGSDCVGLIQAAELAPFTRRGRPVAPRGAPAPRRKARGRSRGR
ncbi:MAG: 50S ribosomal protein L3 N(5)-glutamine methyltransferase [Opitutales bacterium]